jgi:hypothetical protein
MSAVNMLSDMGTTHGELSPRDGQLEDESTSTTGVGTCIHLLRVRSRTDDMPRKASGKEKPTLQSPSCTNPPGPSQ